MKQRTVLALGMFDGVHLAHRELIQKSAAIGAEQGARTLAFTFSNHPGEVFGHSPRLLTDIEERDRLLLEAGAQAVETVPFTQEFSALTPEEFIRQLVEAYSPAAMVTGVNYTFGKQGTGTPELLYELGKRFGFAAYRIPPVLHEGQPVSSSRIRSALEAGEIGKANAMLGRSYRLSGQVVHNLKNGRKLGFPTANLRPDPRRAIPREGVYVTECAVSQGCYLAITNVGNNPTLNGKKQSIESHLIDFTGDLYGAELEVRFLTRIRDQRRFASLEGLKEQLARDLDFAREFDRNGICEYRVKFPQDS